MMDAYCQLHLAGYAHSVESYHKGELVGGLYGISLGKSFFGESMFNLKPDASKVALAALNARLLKWNFLLIDCQVTTNHLLTMGAFELHRKEFIAKLNDSLNFETYKGKWTQL